VDCREDDPVSGSCARLALLAAVVVAALAAPAHAEDSAPVPPAAEAWYASGVGTVVAPLRPAGTLHVGAAAGQETDRTYLRFEVAGAAGDGAVDGVRLTVPLAMEDGTQAPDGAVVLACGVPGTVADGAGDDPPEADCEGAPAATFVDGDAPALTVDLPPPTGGVVQVALVPGGGDTWHLAFDSREREGARPATVVVSSAPAVSPVAPAPPARPDPLPPRPPAVAPITLDTPPPLALPDLSPDPVTPGQVIADEAEASSPTAVITVPAGGSSPFRYPAVFGLPLALLVVLAVAGDGLTRPVRLREAAT
jgi:hypothetical protein